MNIKTAHVPIVGARLPIMSPGAGHISTMHQAPLPPWRNEEEAEEYAADPKTFLLDHTELWREKIKFYHNYIITATYYLPAFMRLANGEKFFLSEKTHDETPWQGKVGLVIAKGPLAFVDCPEAAVFFLGQNVEIGDWLQYDIHDPRHFTVNRVHCRLVKDVHVIAKVEDPRMVY
jgi:hypothetical protein